MPEVPTPMQVKLKYPAKALRFGPTYWEAFQCMEWVRSLGETVESDLNLNKLTIGKSLETSIRADFNWWVVYEDGKFEVMPDGKFYRKYYPA